MMFKFLKIIGIGFILSVKKLLPILFLFTGFQANAILIGNLTYDGTYISGDGRTYLGLWTNASWDYTRTFNATQVNGDYEEFRIATTADADYFIGSLFGANADNCSSTINGWPSYEYCGSIQGWRDGIFGHNYNRSYDIFFFIADQSATREAGEVRIKRGEVVQSEGSKSIRQTDYYGVDGGSFPANTTWIPWLLVKEDTVASVPEPSSIALMGLGIFGIGFVRRRRQS
jgi:hypothetical protein